MARLVDRDERKATIIKAATEVFGLKGYQGATISEIAKKAGMANGTPYLYFKSKEDIFLAVWEEWPKRAVERFAAIGRQTNSSAIERLAALNAAALDIIEYYKRHLGLIIEFQAALRAESLRARMEPSWARVYERQRGVVAGVIEDGVRNGEFNPEVNSEALAQLYISAIDGLIFQLQATDDLLDPVVLLDALMEVLLHGLAAEGRGLLQKASG